MGRKAEREGRGQGGEEENNRGGAQRETRGLIRNYK